MSLINEKDKKELEKNKKAVKKEWESLKRELKSFVPSSSSSNNKKNDILNKKDVILTEEDLIRERKESLKEDLPFICFFVVMAWFGMISGSIALFIYNHAVYGTLLLLLIPLSLWLVTLCCLKYIKSNFKELFEKISRKISNYFNKHYEMMMLIFFGIWVLAMIITAIIILSKQ